VGHRWHGAGGRTAAPGAPHRPHHGLGQGRPRPARGPPSDRQLAQRLAASPGLWAAIAVPCSRRRPGWITRSGTSRCSSSWGRCSPGWRSSATRPPTACCSATGGPTTSSAGGCSTIRRSCRSTCTAVCTSPTTRTSSVPNEPDIALYAGYPMSAASWRRKLLRDATGQFGLEEPEAPLHVAEVQAGAPRRSGADPGSPRLTIWALIWGLTGHWWLYPVCWLGSWMTVWRVLNRLRAIAEHGGMERSKDRRRTTHHIHQSWAARFWIVPVPDRVAPGPPHRHGRAVAQPARVPPGAGRCRVDHRRVRLPELPGSSGRRAPRPNRPGSTRHHQRATINEAGDDPSTTTIRSVNFHRPISSSTRSK
jgi:hypothetical protein